jgi:hypothetical protein
MNRNCIVGLFAIGEACLACNVHAQTTEPNLPYPLDWKPQSMSCSAYAQHDLIDGWSAGVQWDIVTDFKYIVSGRQSFAKYDCGCNNKSYDDITQCTTECKATLSCFGTLICGESKAHFCETAALSGQVTLSNIRIRVWPWQPPAQATPQCLDEATTHNGLDVLHELHHIQLDQAAVARWNASHKDPFNRVTSCASTEEEAHSQNVAKLDAAAAKLKDELEQQLIANGRAWEMNNPNDDVAQVPPLQCSFCE